MRKWGRSGDGNLLTESTRRPKRNLRTNFLQKNIISAEFIFFFTPVITCTYLSTLLRKSVIFVVRDVISHRMDDILHCRLVIAVVLFAPLTGKSSLAVTASYACIVLQSFTPLWFSAKVTNEKARKLDTKQREFHFENVKFFLAFGQEEGHVNVFQVGAGKFIL